MLIKTPTLCGAGVLRKQRVLCLPKRARSARKCAKSEIPLQTGNATGYEWQKCAPGGANFSDLAHFLADLAPGQTAKGKKPGQNVTETVVPDDEGQEKGRKRDRDRNGQVVFGRNFSYLCGPKNTQP